MVVILSVIFILIFFVFLAMGIISHFEGTRKKWIYFTLSSLGLIGTVLMFAFFHWDLGTQLLNNTNKASVEKKFTEKEKTALKEKEKKPSHETAQNQPVPKSEAPSNPAEAVPKTSDTIVIADDGSINYTVTKGDTLWSIAKRAAVTVAEIKQWNGLTSEDIYVGQVLKLYGKNNKLPVANNPEPPSTSGPSVMTYHGNLQKKEIALTFDAGSDIAGIRILDVLKKYNVKATFFLTGKWAEKFPSYARRIANDGYEIGNHSYSHPDPVKISANELKQEISKAEQTIKTVTGKSPRPFFRFPYGSYNTETLKTVGECGYPVSVQWSLDTIDWQQPSSDVIVSRIKAGASNGDIILMHIGGINTPDAVEKAIPMLQAQGYQLVTLSELLN